jgi:hypothetical protein
MSKIHFAITSAASSANCVVNGDNAEDESSGYTAAPDEIRLTRFIGCCFVDR